MKVLILSSYEEVCGIAAYTSELRQALIAAGHSVTVHPIDCPALDRLERTGLAAHFERFFARIPQADAVVIQHEYALYAGSYGYEAACDVFDALLARTARSNKPILVMFHTDPPATDQVPPLPPTRFGRRNAWQRMAATINRSPRVAATVHSPAARRRMMAAGIAAEKISVLALPVPARPHAADEPRQPDGIQLSIFGFVGRYKGYELALRSLALLPPEYRLTIAGGAHPRDPNNTTLPAIRAFLETGVFPQGDLPPLPAAERAAVVAALAGRVAITGVMAESAIARTLARTDIVLLPYTPRGPIQSAAAAWALACRRPIVATDVETFAAIVAERPCMHMVPPGSPEALAAGIRRVAGDQSLRASLMREADLYAETHSWRRAAEFVAGRLAQPSPVSPLRRLLGFGRPIASAGP